MQNKSDTRIDIDQLFRQSSDKLEHSSQQYNFQTNPEIQEVKQIQQNLYEKFLNYLEQFQEKDKWLLEDEMAGIYQVYSRQDKIFVNKKSITYVDYSIQNLFQHVLDFLNISKQNPFTQKILLLKEFDQTITGLKPGNIQIQNTKLIQVITKSPIPLRQRDFALYSSTITIGDNRKLLIYASTQNDEIPKQKNYKRANADLIVWEFLKQSENKTQINFLLKIDPKVKLVPKFIIDQYFLMGGLTPYYLKLYLDKLK